MPKQRGRGRPRGSRNKASGGVGAEMLASLSSYRQQILSEIAGLQRQANALSMALSAMGGGAAPARFPARVGRPVGPAGPAGPVGPAVAKLAGGRVRAAKGSLKECIIKVLSQSSRPVPVKDMISGVKRVGYKTNSSSLGNQISMALRVMPQVKKVAHGLYGLTG